LELGATFAGDFPRHVDPGSRTHVGTHQRVSLHDAFQYRDARHERQYTFLADTQTDDEPPRDQVLADLKRIRTELGTRRRVNDTSPLA